MKKTVTLASFPKYQILPTGAIYSGYRNIVMVPRCNPNGYMQIGLRNGDNKRKTMYVHRLVAEAFCIKEKGQTYVNHKDGNKCNNHPRNLEWCTAIDNMRHAHDTGLHQQDGEQNAMCKFSDDEIARVFILREDTDLTQRAIGAVLGMCQQHVSQILVLKARA